MMRSVILAIAMTLGYLTVHADFGHFASAVYISTNGSNSFYNTTDPGNAQTIGTASFSGNLGNFTTNTATLVLKGGEMKTFKQAGSNVCGATLYYRVYLTGSATPPAFNPIPFNFLQDLGGGDQVWQQIGQSIDLTAYPVGNYTLEVYYTYTGDAFSTSGCGTTRFDSNNSANYKATFSISSALPVAFEKVEASIKNKMLQVTWETGSEMNSHHFEIYGSVDGFHFSKLGSVTAKGNSSGITAYNFSMEADSARTGLLGAGFLLGFVLLSVTSKKRKFSIALFCLLGMSALFIGCSKGTGIEPENGKQLLIKVVGIDIDGKTTQSKIVQAIQQ